MSAIKSKGTKPELILAKALWERGHRYRKNNPKVFGKPDFTFKKYKIAIFVDGEFFHGHNWSERKEKLISNREYWIPKIEKNIARDKAVNQHLIASGWQVIRFWSKFINAHLDLCISIIEREIENAEVK